MLKGAPLKIIFLAIPLFILLFLGVSFFSIKAREEKWGSRLVLGSIGDASFLNPVLSQDSASGDINGLVYNGLLKYNRNLVLTGDLASSWKVIPGDKPEIIFELRKGVLWHDGAPFTARDVIFTYKVIMDKKTNTVRRSDYELVESVTAQGDFTISVKYKKPFSPGLESWTIGIIPEHILRDEDINTTFFNRRPVGTGPFCFKEWISDEKIVLEANARYFEGRPHLDEIIYRIIPETSLMEIELLTGGVDYAGVFPHQFERMKKNPDFDTHKQTSLGYTYIGYNCERPLFRDKAVRQALTCAVNREEILTCILYGHGVAATGPFPPHMWYYNPGLRAYPPDLEKARRLLADAGWVDTDGDGLLDKNGKPLAFTLITNSGNDTRKDIAVLVQRRWKKLGIKATPQLYEWSTFINTYINPRNFDACILGWSLSVDPDCYSIWHSSQIKDGFNFVSYRNEEVDSLLEEGRSEYNRKKRKAIYGRIAEILAEDAPYTFLYVPQALSSLRRKFVIVEEDKKGREVYLPIKAEKAGVLYDVNKWTVNPVRRPGLELLQP